MANVLGGSAPMIAAPPRPVGQQPVVGGLGTGPRPVTPAPSTTPQVRQVANPFNPAPTPAPATPTPTTPATPLVNTAQNDPNLSGFFGQIKDRIAQQTKRETMPDPNLQTQVNRLGERLGSDTRQRAQDFAAQDINARARASQSALQESLARRGIGGNTGTAAELGSRIQDQAQREAARSAAGIGLADEARKDSLVLGGQGIMAAPGQQQLQREGMTNSLLGLGQSSANALAGQNLADRNLNLNQWQAQNQQANAVADQAQRAKDQQLAQLLAFTRMGQDSGVGGTITNGQFSF